MNESYEEYEFTHKTVFDGVPTHTTLHFKGDIGQSYNDVVDKFLGFLSATYGYPITVESLARDAGYNVQEWPEFGST